MAQAKMGDKVKVHYTGYLKDGTVFESSPKEEPFVFTIGRGEVIPGFENAVIGMNEEDIKSVTIPPEDAYGHYKKDNVATVDKSKIPSNIDPKLGMQLQVRTPEGIITNVTVTEITENSVILDGNHPLAGKKLTFEIKLLEIL